MQDHVARERAVDTFEEVFRVAVDQLTDAIVIVDAQGRVLYANPAFTEATGRTLDDLAGRHVRATRFAPQKPRFYRDLQRTLAREREWRCEYDAQGPDGEVRRIAVTVTRVPIADGCGERFIVAARDVTHERRLEYIAEANNLVENVGYVFASLRHELGNPVNSIKTALTVMRSCVWDLSASRVDDYFDRLLQEVGRMEYLLRSLQSFDTSSRPKLEPVPVVPFLHGFAKMIRADVVQRGVDLVVVADESVGSAVAEPRALHQVMLNLVTNALDALTGRPDAIIRISATRRAHVRIQVADNGPGIAPASRARVFRPFYTTKPKGTGLGLAITRKLVTFMRGTLEVESAPGGGALFVIALDPHEPQESSRRAATVRPPPPRGDR